ncbi:MAG: ABC transporter ATP-binding protein [bacterium]|nr:ABC transporter ATP-binding protein [bacterium]
MSDRLVELRGVGRRFGDATEVLRDVDLEVGPRETIAVLGPSGSGKSTLLNIIGGLLPPTTGSVTVAGQQLGDLSTAQMATLRNRELGFVFQTHHLLPQCTALENVLVPTLADPQRKPGPETATRARELLTEIGLGDRLDHRPAQLSGGECQRVAVVRALINEPRLVLADEPTGSLDEQSADRLGDLLTNLNEQHGVALVVVTHSQRLAQRMQRVLTLQSGALVPADIAT